MGFGPMKSPPQERLDPVVLRQFLSHCREREFGAGAMIIAAADLPDRIYYLVSGSVEVMIEDDEGHEMILAYLNRGHFFGEMGYFDRDTRSRSAWVRARSDVRVAEMGYGAFAELAARHIDLVIELTTQMALRLFGTDAKLGNLAFLDVKGRVAHALIDLCREPDAEATSGGWLLSVTRPQIARLVGCSREMVWRVLKTLQSEGLIFDVEEGIVVRDQSFATEPCYA